MREALFSAIESWCGSLQGLRFLDLYAGSGAVGLEAWSRGAGVVTMVEQDRRTAALIAANAKTLGFAKANVVVGVGGRDAGAAAGGAVRHRLPRPALPDRRRGGRRRPRRGSAASGWCPARMVVVERSSRSREPVWPDGFTDTRERKYGETTLWYGHAARL